MSDFSRMTFDPSKHFLRVLMQQGRVQLDSDWNEQTAILLHYLQTVVKDIIGPYAGPEGEDYGFKITEVSKENFKIGKGRYYVNGILVENEEEVWYRPVDDGGVSQPDLPEPELLDNNHYLVYLDVWERPITTIQDDDIREKALGGPDTTTRSKVVWQVKVKEFTSSPYSCLDGASLLEKEEIALSPVCLSARAKREQAPTEPCLIDPESRYRGAENQLYRVEIHQGGIKRNSDKPTFKWSRDNGSVVFPLKEIISEDTISSPPTITVELEHLGRNSRFSLSEGDWVELVNDDYTLQNKAEPLLQVFSIDRVNREVTLTGTTDVSDETNKHPFLRRWDHKKVVEGKLHNGAIPFPEKGKWVELEDGIEIQFHTVDGNAVRSGDYWLIPARTATGDVEWPKQIDEEGKIKKDADGYPVPKLLPPHGIMHHYAPLAIIAVAGNTVSVTECRCSFTPLSHACPYSDYGQLGIGIDLICSEEE
jgi:hypothetical protein